jgi:hypothetical protein
MAAGPSAGAVALVWLLLAAVVAAEQRTDYAPVEAAGEGWSELAPLPTNSYGERVRAAASHASQQFLSGAEFGAAPLAGKNTRERSAMSSADDSGCCHVAKGVLSKPCTHPLIRKSVCAVDRRCCSGQISHAVRASDYGGARPSGWDMVNSWDKFCIQIAKKQGYCKRQMKPRVPEYLQSKVTKKRVAATAFSDRETAKVCGRDSGRHSRCQHPGVRDCVCKQDDYCCNNVWDSYCASQAGSCIAKFLSSGKKEPLAKPVEPCNSTKPEDLSCCKRHSSPKCGDGQVNQCVCKIEFDCCSKSWDAYCVHLAKSNCNVCSSTCLLRELRIYAQHTVCRQSLLFALK